MDLFLMAFLGFAFVVLVMALAMVRVGDIDFEDDETWESHFEAGDGR